MLRMLIRWLGLLGRCVGASYHASFCCGRAVYSGCVLGTFDCVQLQFTLSYHDVAVVMIVICLCVSCPSLVSASILWGATPHITCCGSLARFDTSTRVPLTADVGRTRRMTRLSHQPVDHAWPSRFACMPCDGMMQNRDLQRAALTSAHAHLLAHT